jgi:hypothetical protein
MNAGSATGNFDACAFPLAAEEALPVRPLSREGRGVGKHVLYKSFDFALHL